MYPSEVHSVDATRDTAKATFADDIGLWAIGRPAAMAAARIQAELRRTELWTDRWRLELNPAKCEAMLFGYYGGHAPRVILTVKGAPIKVSNSFCYLGVNLTSHLAWSKQVDSMVAKAACRIAGLRTLCYSGQISPRTGMFFYKAAIRPIFEYGAPCFGELPTTTLKRLQVLENRAIKAILGLPKRTPTVEVDAERLARFPDLEPIQDRLDDLSFRYGQSSLDYSAEIGGLIRQARANPSSSKSPLRRYLQLLGAGPLTAPVDEPIVYTGALTASDDEDDFDKYR